MLSVTDAKCSTLDWTTRTRAGSATPNQAIADPYEKVWRLSGVIDSIERRISMVV